MDIRKIGLFVLVVLALLVVACQPVGGGGEVVSPGTTDETAEVPDTGVETDDMTGSEATEDVAGGEATEEVAGGETGEACLSGVTREELVSTGSELYAANCAGCHGDQGQGQGDFPPLADNEMATAEDVVEMLQVVVNPEVHPFITNLDPNDIAAALSFVRASFGNDAAAICPEDITLGSTQ